MISHKISRLFVLATGLVALVAVSACTTTETVEVIKEVPVEKIVTKEVPVEVEKIVTKEVAVEVEKIVTKEVPVEVIKEVAVETIKEISVPKTVLMVATATPDPDAGKVVSSGEVTAAISNVYFMNSSPRYCPACSVQARTGATEFLLTAVRDENGQIGISGQIAESWTQSEDGTSWTEFKLREGIQL